MISGARSAARGAVVFALAVALAGAGCGGTPEDAGDGGASFVAFAPDFAAFSTWEHVTFESAAAAGATHVAGKRDVYINRKPPEGATTYPVGTIIVETRERHLYLIESETRALRYGIGVGREGFTWSGLLQITQKQQWPDWHPPPEMIQRQPYLPRFMAGGPGNPLGARAMHLGSTVYRIHGTNAPETIGHAVSSGCFRLVNEDVIDLYDRVPVGTHVIVRQN